MPREEVLCPCAHPPQAGTASLADRPAFTRGASGSRCTVRRRAARSEPQRPADQIASDVNEAPVMSISVGAQPDERLIDADTKLLSEHAGRLIDLRPVPP